MSFLSPRSSSNFRNCHVPRLRQVGPESSRSPAQAQPVVQRRPMGVQTPDTLSEVSVCVVCSFVHSNTRRPFWFECVCGLFFVCSSKHAMPFLKWACVAHLFICLVVCLYTQSPFWGVFVVHLFDQRSNIFWSEFVCRLFVQLFICLNTRCRFWGKCVSFVCSNT